MKFLIVTHAIHKKNKGHICAYEPYVREMNLWLKNVDEFKIIAPFSKNTITKIESEYEFQNIIINAIPKFDILTFYSFLKAIFKIPVVFFEIFKGMLWAEHIHLRCPGNIGLLGCLVQILFPSKPKTVKYAGNWDPNSKQPLSYRLQKKILSNTFLTKNCKVLVYGKWKNQSKNIVPFFTASYKKEEIVDLPKKTLDGKLRFIFVGSFSKGKQPLLSVKTAEELINKGFNVTLDMFGKGELFDSVLNYIKEKSLEKYITLHGNQPKEVVKKSFQKSHFLIFISKSEGWPKVVAEAMFWGCLPISSKVSCVPYMLDQGKRGFLVNANTTAKDISKLILEIFQNKGLYNKMIKDGKEWSQQFTLDSFEKAIKKFL